MASRVGEAQQSVQSQKREVNEREEELCWGKDVLPKKYENGVETGAVDNAPLAIHFLSDIRPEPARGLISF